MPRFPLLGEAWIRKVLYALSLGLGEPPVVTFAQQFSTQNVKSAPTPDVFDLRSELYKIA